MIAIEKIAANAHCIVVMGAFDEADAKQVVEFAKSQATIADDTEGTSGGNLLINLSALSNFSLSAIGEELRNVPVLWQYIRGLERIAIVSDQGWIRNLARLESALLPNVTYEVYSEDEAETAREWVLGTAQKPHAEAVRRIEEDRRGMFALAVSGRLDRETASRVLSEASEALSDPDCSRLLVVIENWHGFDMDTLMSEGLFSTKIDLIDKIDRYAIVGGPGWLRSLATGIAPMIACEIRGFDDTQKNEAIAWLEE